MNHFSVHLPRMLCVDRTDSSFPGGNRGSPVTSLPSGAERHRVTLPLFTPFFLKENILMFTRVTLVLEPTTRVLARADRADHVFRAI